MSVDQSQASPNSQASPQTYQNTKQEIETVQNSSVIHSHEVKLFTLRDDVKGVTYMILPFWIKINNQLPISHKTFFTLSKKANHLKKYQIKNEISKKKSYYDGEWLKQEIMEEEDEEDDDEDETSQKRKNSKKFRILNSKKRREYIKLINSVTAVFVPFHIQKETSNISDHRTRMSVYLNTPSCLLDKKRINILKNYVKVEVKTHSKSSVVKVDKVVQKQCLWFTKEIDIYGFVQISLDKGFLSNFDDSFNYVLRFDKRVKDIYKHIDLLVVARYSRIKGFQRQLRIKYLEKGENRRKEKKERSIFHGSSEQSRRSSIVLPDMTPKNHHGGSNVIKNDDKDKQSLAAFSVDPYGAVHSTAATIAGKAGSTSENGLNNSEIFLERVLHIRSFSLVERLPKNTQEPYLEVVKKIDLSELNCRILRL